MDLEELNALAGLLCKNGYTVGRTFRRYGRDDHSHEWTFHDLDTGRRVDAPTADVLETYLRACYE